MIIWVGYPQPSKHKRLNVCCPSSLLPIHLNVHLNGFVQKVSDQWTKIRNYKNW